MLSGSGLGPTVDLGCRSRRSGESESKCAESEATTHSHTRRRIVRIVLNRKGVIYAAASYIAWGFMPIYWKALRGASALEILSHRIVWALAFNLILLAVLGRWSWIKRVIGDRKLLLVLLGSTTLLSINWLVYIWAVNAGHIVDASLGYFINPLVNVALGVLFFKERMRPGQWLAFGSAAAGVLYLTISTGVPPWIALTLAASFGIYGALRKVARLDSLEGLTLETALVAPLAAGYAIFLGMTGAGAFGHNGLDTTLLIAAGAATAVPLLLFAAGVRRIPMTTLGILQYVAPTIQFLLGALLYHEPFGTPQLIGFGGVWLALAIYTIESVIAQRRATADHIAAMPKRASSSSSA